MQLTQGILFRTGIVLAALGAAGTIGCSASSLKELFSQPGAGEEEWVAHAAGESPASDSAWLTSLSEAQQRSRETGKPILMDFTGSDWCHWCQKLDGEVFAKKEFQEWASENVILLEVDFPRYGDQSELTRRQNEQLRDQYAISSYPTLLLVDSEGEVLGKLGYVRGGPQNWIAAAEREIR